MVVSVHLGSPASQVIAVVEVGHDLVLAIVIGLVVPGFVIDPPNVRVGELEPGL